VGEAVSGELCGAGTPAQCHKVFVGNEKSALLVGRTPWSAADAPVGLLAPCKMLTPSACFGPTIRGGMFALGFPIPFQHVPRPCDGTLRLSQPPASLREIQFSIASNFKNLTRSRRPPAISPDNPHASAPTANPSSSSRNQTPTPPRQRPQNEAATHSQNAFSALASASLRLSGNLLATH
jgi:hypothetical protein